MALFQYFPNNYVWNLSVAIALESGGRMGEIEDMCAPLRAAAARGEDAGTGEFLRQWLKCAENLVALADEDLALGRGYSAAEKLDRASLYFQVAERMQDRSATARKETYAKAVASFQRSIEAGNRNFRRVEIPYEKGVIAGYLTLAEARRGPSPTVVYVNGLDSTKEMLAWSGLPLALARRGISTLSIDQPGTGEALRLHNLHAVYDTERWASPVVDWLEKAARSRPPPNWHGRHFAGRVLRPSGRRKRASFRLRVCLGRQSRLGTGAGGTPPQ